MNKYKITILRLRDPLYTLDAAKVIAGSGIFFLNLEEAAELLSNTPLVLEGHLKDEQYSQLREKFQEAGCSVTFEILGDEPVEDEKEKIKKLSWMKIWKVIKDFFS